MSLHRYLIVGLGATGLSVARFLNSVSTPFALFDTRHDLNLDDILQEFPGITPCLGDWQSLDLTTFTHIILSPGVAQSHPLIQKARLNGLIIWGDIELFAQHVKAPVIAVTGTNGKSTVVSLVGLMAEAMAINSVVAGNIGVPVLDLFMSQKNIELWVLELSSFQLETVSSLKLVASVVLNISDDHLDRYESLNAYARAKHAIHHHSQRRFYNREDALTRPVETDGAISLGLSVPTHEWDWGLVVKNEVTYLSKGWDCLIALNDVRIKGAHNYYNAMAACALADCVGVSIEIMKRVLLNFTGLPHRCQWIRHLDEVDWYNDSKGTNVGATVSAIQGMGQGMQGKIVLIVGGQGKGANFKPLKDPAIESVRVLVLIGEDASLIEEALDSSIPFQYAKDMGQAVHLARRAARPGDVVMLSPACASFDMFDNFSHRGDVFTQCVMGL